MTIQERDLFTITRENVIVRGALNSKDEIAGGQACNIDNGNGVSMAEVDHAVSRVAADAKVVKSIRRN